jgi:hypothetical protein
MTAGLRWNPAQELVDGLPRPDSELARLAGGLHDGSLTRPDRDRLETLLEHPDARRAFRKLSNLHANLLCLWHETAQAQGDGGPQEQGGSSAAAGSGRGRTRRNADLSNRFAAAVAVVARGALGWLRKLGRPVPLACLVAGAVLTAGLTAFALVRIDAAAHARISAAPTAHSVAFIADVHDARWGRGPAAAEVGDFLASGARLEIRAGLVEVMYFGGAKVVVEGPASFVVTGPAAGRLIAGRLVAKTDHPAQAPAAVKKSLFTVHTPRGVIDDLGTEFGVEVPREGDESVHVFEGLVAVAAGDARPAESGFTVEAGRSAAIDGDLTVRRIASAASRRFVRTLPLAKPKQPVAEQPAGGEPKPPRPAVWHGENVEEFAPIKARYVRFAALETNGLEPCLDELEIFATDGRNVARDGTATASGTIPGYAMHAAAHVNDGLYGNDHSWVSDAPRGWIQIELPVEAEIDRIVWSRDRTASPLYVDRVPTKYVVSVSLDGKLWRHVAASGNRLPFGSPRPAPESQGAPAR